MVESLLSRCVYEVDTETRVLLAECFAEIGAIDSHRLEEAKRSVPKGAGGGNLDSWRLSNPPWRSRRSDYEFELVSKFLVAALKAAATSADQHKVAFCIQQLLVLLNKSEGGSSTNAVDGDNGSSGVASMSESLKAKLCGAKVFDQIEPFWSSQFSERAGISIRQSQPPFFECATEYNQWMTCWCSFMIHRAKNAYNSVWNELFFACRTAVRTTAGLGVAEFLLPLLLLDRLCFGDSQDERILLQEIHDALSFEATSSKSQMDWTDRQKTVSTLFAAIETLELWAEHQAERQYHYNKRSSRRGASSAMSENPVDSDWPLEDAVMRIEDFSRAIPLALRASAAAKVGMNARSLRLLEMNSRKAVSGAVFEGTTNAEVGSWKPNRSRAAGTCPQSETVLMKDVLAALHDYETVSALDDYKHTHEDLTTCVKDSIREKEAAGDWEGALQDYERAQQLSGSGHKDPSLQCGALRCLLELGHFESALNQVRGTMLKQSGSSVDANDLSSDHQAVILGAEAAWRLGRWETLSDLVESGMKGTSENPECQYQLSVSQLMLAVKNKNKQGISLELRNARSALMVGLSSSARESYSRAYDQIVRLQALGEIEETAALLCSQNKVGLREYVSSLGWDRRLDFVSSTGASTIIKTRLALSRLAGDTAYEGSLFLNLGKRARKKDLYNIAANAFAQAEASFASLTGNASTDMSTLQIQVAKLKHESGESSAALRMLGLENIETLGGFERDRLVVEAKRYVRETLREHGSSMSEGRMVDVFVQSALQSTRWMVDGSLKDVPEIRARFHVIHRLSPKWEKGTKTLSF